MNPQFLFTLLWITDKQHTGKITSDVKGYITKVYLWILPNGKNWIHWDTIMSVEGLPNIECEHVDSPSKKKVKMQPSACKVICTVFWVRKGMKLLNLVLFNFHLFRLMKDGLCRHFFLIMMILSLKCKK